MTATRDRGREARAASVGPRWDGRSAFGTRGWPWWGAVLLALGLSIVGAVIDEETSSTIDTVFRAAFVIGAVGAVCIVSRRSLFGPMVQPPLILVVVVPLVAAALDNKPGSKVLVIGPLLIDNFPVMAITTGVTVVIGAVRYLVQRKPASEGPRADRDRPRRPESRDRERVPASRDREPARDRDYGDRPSPSRGGRPASGSRSSQDRGVPRDRTRADPGRGRSSSADRGRDMPRSRDRDDDRGQPPRGRAPRDVPRREPRRRDDDY